ncbi:YdcF family protein [Candidatus Aerophobetes bacterium]|nr:YdcF family protein [Candidatus Aerophobetes bacterium]
MSRNLRKALFTSGIVFLIVFATLYLPFTQYQLTKILTVEEDIYPARAIVVLGGGLSPDGSLGKSTQERLNYAVHLFKLGFAEYLILSGGDREDDKMEADQMYEMVLSKGIASWTILKEPYSLNTYENALYVEEILSHYRIEGEIILVTSPYHMRRALLCFKQKGIEVLPAPVKNSEIYTYGAYQSFRNLRLLVREILAFVWYGYRGWI